MCAVRPARLSAARASENPRRNRCFQSSVGKFAPVETGRQRGPLTGEHDARSRAAVKGPIRCGVFTQIARRPGGVTSRKSDEFITGVLDGQGEVGRLLGFAIGWPRRRSRGRPSKVKPHGRPGRNRPIR